MNARIIIVFLLVWALGSCTGTPGNTSGTTGSTAPRTLPYIGEHDVEFKTNAGGERIPDTVYYTVSKFSFIDQDSLEFTQKNYEGFIYITDFFFTTCPSICPVMSSQMSRLQDLLRADQLLGPVKLLSHTVDPARDTPAVLKAYGEKLGADFTHWNFVTGPAEDLYYQAQQGYFLTALPSDTAAGGFFHSDQFALIDGGRHIRGYYDGTSSKEVNQLFEDIKTLVREQSDSIH